MKKIFKNVFALCFALCGIIAIFGLTACNPTTPDPNPNTGDFVIYVQYEDGTGVAGVWASWCVMNDNSGVCISANNATDANGKTSIQESVIVNDSLKTKSFHVKLEMLPEGYTYTQDSDGYYNGDGYIITTENRTVTIVLKKA